jgi:hypothetical protein
MNLVASGDNSIPEHFQKLMRKKQGVGLDIKWRLLNRKLFPWDDTNPLLSKAHAIFGVSLLYHFVLNCVMRYAQI